MATTCKNCGGIKYDHGDDLFTGRTCECTNAVTPIAETLSTQRPEIASILCSADARSALSPNPSVPTSSVSKSAGRYVKFLLSCSACGLLLRLGIGMIASHGLWDGLETILTALWFARCALLSDFGSVQSVQSVAKKNTRLCG